MPPPVSIDFSEEEESYTKRVVQEYVKKPQSPPSSSPWTFLHVLSLIQNNWAYDSLCGIDPLVAAVPQKEGRTRLSNILRIKKAFYAPSYQDRFNQLARFMDEVGEKNDAPGLTLEFSSDWKLVQKELKSCNAKSKIKEETQKRRVFSLVLCLIRDAVITADDARRLYDAAFRLSKSDKEAKEKVTRTWPSFHVPNISQFFLDLKGVVKYDAASSPTFAIQCLRSQLHLEFCHGGLWKSTKDKLLDLKEWVAKEKLTSVCPLQFEDVTVCGENAALSLSLAWSGLLSEYAAACYSFDAHLAQKFSYLATVVLEGCKVRGQNIPGVSMVCSIQFLANAVCLPRDFVDVGHEHVLSELARLQIPGGSFGVVEMCLLHFHNLFFSLPNPPTPVFQGDSVLAQAWMMLNALLGGDPNELGDPGTWMRERFQPEARRRNKKLADCLNPSEPVLIPVFSEERLKEDGWETAEEDNDDLFN